MLPQYYFPPCMYGLWQLPRILPCCAATCVALTLTAAFCRTFTPRGELGNWTRDENDPGKVVNWCTSVTRLSGIIWRRESPPDRSYRLRLTEECFWSIKAIRLHASAMVRISHLRCVVEGKVRVNWKLKKKRTQHFITAFHTPYEFRKPFYTR